MSDITTLVWGYQALISRATTGWCVDVFVGLFPRTVKQLPHVFCYGFSSAPQPKQDFAEVLGERSFSSLQRQHQH